MPSVRAKLIARNAHIQPALELLFHLPCKTNLHVFLLIGIMGGAPFCLTWLRSRQDANLLITRSRIFADAGNAGEAIRSILTVHRLAHLLDGEPAIHFGVTVQGYNLSGIADEQIERLLNQFALNDAQLLALHQSIASFNVPAQYANAFISERCSVIATDETVRNGSSAEIQKIGGGG